MHVIILHIQIYTHTDTLGKDFVKTSTRNRLPVKTDLPAQINRHDGAMVY